MSRQTWTLPKLRRAVSEVESGRTWDDVAADYGVMSATLRRVLRHYKVWPDEAKRQARPHPQEQQLVRAMRLRSETSRSWPFIAKVVGWEGLPASLARAAQRRSSC